MVNEYKNSFKSNGVAEPINNCSENTKQREIPIECRQYTNQSSKLKSHRKSNTSLH